MVFLNVSGVKLGKEAKKIKFSRFLKSNQFESSKDGTTPLSPSFLHFLIFLDWISLTLGGNKKKWKELQPKPGDRLPAEAKEEDQAQSPT